MAFSFGGVTPTVKPSEATQERADFLLLDHRTPGFDWYLVLVPSVIVSARVIQLKKELEKEGMLSFVIATAMSIPMPEDKKSVVEKVKNFDSGWRVLLREKPRAVLAIGAALYAITGSADVIADDFTPVFVKPYLSVGKFDGTIETTIFPTHDLQFIFLREGEVTWRRRWFRKQVHNCMGNYELPDPRGAVITVLDTIEKANAWMQAHFAPELLAMDTETDGFDTILNHVGCVTLCVDGVEGVYIPWRCVDIPELVKLIKSAKRLVGANGKFDAKHLWHMGVDPMGWNYTDDVGQLAHALVPGRSMNLKALAYYFTQFGGYDDKLDEAKKTLKVENYLQIPEKILSVYAAMDAIVTYRVYIALKKLVHQIDEAFPNEKQAELLKCSNNPDSYMRWGPLTNDIPPEERGGKPWTIWRWYEEVMMPEANDCSYLEYVGLYVNPKERDAGQAFLEEEIAKERKTLSELWNVREDFDFLSNKALGKQIFEMSWPISFSDKGNIEVNDSVLTDYIRENRPGAKNLQRLRSLYTQRGTFVGYEENGIKKGWYQYFRYHPEDDTWRIHTQFASMLAETFRHRSAAPNFQNATSRGELAHLIKKVVDVKHTYQYRVKSNGKEYVFPHDAKVPTNRGSILARELREDDVLLDGHELESFKVERKVRRVISSN
jgi:hypothetical protein